MTTQPHENEVKQAVELLDRLLGVDARKPGAAAVLPAAIRLIEELEPAGGFDFPVFPASYAGAIDNDPPVYDLSGIVYGEVRETIRAKGRRTVERPQIVKADRCTLDSPQSQANRTEVAFLEDGELRSLVPQASAQIPRGSGQRGNESVLRLPHRVADFRVRLSDKQEHVKAAISDFADGDALKLLRLMPTSIVFGFWDSRGGESQHKHARILLSRIDAFDVVPRRRHALYSGPYSKDEFAEAVLSDKALASAAQDEDERETEQTKASTPKKVFDRMAERGFTPAPSEGLGGVLVKGRRIERLALVSLTDIARLRCHDENKKDEPNLTNAARRYVFALAALAEGYPRSTGSHRLRSGCELLTNNVTVDVRGGGPNYMDTAALKGLFTNRVLLRGVAEDAKKILNIPESLPDFVVSKESLKGDFDGTAKPEANGNSADPKRDVGAKGRRSRGNK
jgi:CRISPR-associated protein Csb1